jgi:hypothetical protein
VKARVVERQIERDLPAQVEANGVHRALVGEPVAIGEQQHLGEQAGRDRGPAVALGVAVSEVLVAHDPIAVLGEQRVDRLLGEQLRAPCSVEEALLSIRRREHPDLP